MTTSGPPSCGSSAWNSPCWRVVPRATAQGRHPAAGAQARCGAWRSRDSGRHPGEPARTGTDRLGPLPSAGRRARPALGRGADLDGGRPGPRRCARDRRLRQGDRAGPPRWGDRPRRALVEGRAHRPRAGPDDRRRPRAGRPAGRSRGGRAPGTPGRRPGRHRQPPAGRPAPAHPQRPRGRRIPADDFFDPEELLPAPGQGALAIQVREGDADLGPLVAALDHPPTRSAVTAERAILRGLGGGCMLPVATYARHTGGVLVVEGAVTSADGTRQARARAEGEPSMAMALGAAVAEQLMDLGALQLLEQGTVARQP